MTSRTNCDLPDHLLDEAFRWAVVLGSGTRSDRDRREFERWLETPQHRVAWQRIEMIEQEFAAARDSAGVATKALERVEARRRTQSLKRVVGALLSLVLLAGLLLSPLRYLWQAQHVTGDEGLAIELAGGARVYLDTDTAVDIEQVAGTTVVQLHHGRILVDSSAAVVADKPRVVTSDGSFTPLGTRFVVAREQSVTELAMLQGKVLIAVDDDQHAEASAGERWRVRADGIERMGGDGLQPGVWLDGVIEADNARLGDVLAALGRYRHGWLRCDPAIASLRVTGLFHLDDIDGALQALEQSLPVRVERTTDWWVSVQARAQ